MSSTDFELNRILNEIERCEANKKKVQREINHFSDEVARMNKELEYYRKEMTDLDREYSRLVEAETRRRNATARENQIPR
ncbi:MAG: hypothetical protein WAW13_01875 [Minisyncoccia bacterium]